LANSSRWRSFINESASCRATVDVNFCGAIGCILPWVFMVGGKSAEMNKSDPPARHMAVRSFTM